MMIKGKIIVIVAILHILLNYRLSTIFLQKHFTKFEEASGLKSSAGLVAKFHTLVSYRLFELWVSRSLIIKTYIFGEFSYDF